MINKTDCIQPLNKPTKESLRFLELKMLEELRTIKEFNKSNRNEWDFEPNELEWTDSQTGLQCRIIRNQHLKILLGYVGVQLAAQLSREQKDFLKVHGGISYENYCETHKYCWFGFDCGHAFDLIPAMIEHGANPDFNLGDSVIKTLYGRELLEHETYKNIFFTIHHCQLLALQLKKFEFIKVELLEHMEKTE